MLRLVIATTALALVASCSSGGSGKPSTSRPSIASSSAFVTHYGQDAAIIASHIAGCTDVRAGSIGNGSATGMSSTATCALSGHVLILDSWKDAGSSDIVATARDSKATTYYAHGQGWTAFLADDGVTADKTLLQMQLTNDAAGLLAESQNPNKPADADAQQTIAQAVASALGGSVQHVTA